MTIQDSDAARAALDQFERRPALGYSGCLLVEIARKAGHVPLGTFDRRLSRIDGTGKL